jgi:hypothetical protein
MKILQNLWCLKKLFAIPKPVASAALTASTAGASFLPYTVKYVPLFYLHFMAETDLQYLKIEELEG